MRTGIAISPDQAITSAIDSHVQAEQHDQDEEDGQAGALAPVASQARKINN
jgi:hypothetical protein